MKEVWIEHEAAIGDPHCARCGEPLCGRFRPGPIYTRENATVAEPPKGDRTQWCEAEEREG